MKYVALWGAFTFVGMQMLDWINSQGLDALVTLPKGLMLALPTKHDSHLGNLTLVSWSKRSSSANLLILSWPTLPSRACYLTYLELELKYGTKAEDVL